MNFFTRYNTLSLATVTAAIALLPANMAFAEAGESDSGFMSLIPLVLIMVIFWVLLIRPQQKRVKEHAALIGNLKKGNKIITNGGVFGQITDVKDGFLIVEIAEGVRVKMKNDAVASLQEVEAAKSKAVKSKADKTKTDNTAEK